MPANRQLRQLTTELTTPMHLAPLSAYRATKPPHLAVEQSTSIKLSRDRATSSRASRDSCPRIQYSDPPRESFQLSGRSSIRCMKHKRMHASLVHSCRARARAPSTWPKDMRLCAKGGSKALRNILVLFFSSARSSTSFFWRLVSFNVFSHSSFTLHVLSNAIQRNSRHGIPRRIIILQFRRHAVHTKGFFSQLIPQVYRTRQQPPPPSLSSTAQRRRFTRGLKRPLVSFLWKVGLASSCSTRYSSDTMLRDSFGKPFYNTLQLRKD